MKLKTKVCELLGIKYPIIQGGMAWVSDHHLVIAVCKAGGLGTIGAGNMPPDLLGKEILEVKAALGNKSFAVNLMLLNPEVEKQMDVVIKEGVPIVILGAGDPSGYIEELHNQKIKVLSITPSIALAKKVAKKGIDGVIAEGSEAGGHIGRFSTLVLVPAIVDALEDEGYNIPVIAAGGIYDGKSLVAAFILGASGVQMATRFVCAEETNVHPDVKEAFLKANDVTKVVVTGLSIGWPVQMLKNQLYQLYRDWEKDYLLGKKTREEVESLGVGKLREAMIEGNVVSGSVMAGQSVIRVNKIQPVVEIIEEVVREAIGILSNLKMEGVEVNE